MINTHDEYMSTELFIPDALKIPCKRHAVKGVPCFHIPKANGQGYFAGICNARAKKAGFRGRINRHSLQQR